MEVEREREMENKNRELSIFISTTKGDEFLMFTQMHIG